MLNNLQNQIKLSNSSIETLILSNQIILNLSNSNNFELNNQPIVLNIKEEEELKENEKTVKEISVSEEKNYPNRRTMEDTHVIKECLYKYNNHIISLFCIFDGHGGRQSALKSKEIVCEIMKNTMKKHEYDSSHLMELSNNQYSKEYKEEMKNMKIKFEEIMKEVSNEMDKRIFNEIKDESGCTALFCLIDKKEDKRIILSANIGDSLGCIFTEYGILPMSIPHRTDDEKERERIENLGGIIFNGRVNQVIAVTRSLGDENCKPYVSNEAFCNILCYDSCMKYIVLGCDGLWDFVDYQEIYEFLQEKENDFDGISNELIKLSIKNKSTDNISVIVLKL